MLFCGLIKGVSLTIYMLCVCVSVHLNLFVLGSCFRFFFFFFSNPKATWCLLTDRVHVTPLLKLWGRTSPTPQPRCWVLATCWNTSTRSTTPSSSRMLSTESSKLEGYSVCVCVCVCVCASMCFTCALFSVHVCFTCALFSLCVCV